MTGITNPSTASAFVKPEGITSVLESLRSGQALNCLSAGTGRHGITHLPPFSGLSRKGKVGNELSINQLGVRG